MTGTWQPTSFAKRGRSTYMRMGPDTWICLRVIDPGDPSKPLKEIYRLRWFV